MPKAKKITHTGPHKYLRGTLGTKGHEIYKCQIPNCSHYLPTTFLAINAISLCWGDCGCAVLMDKQLVNVNKIKRPYCEDCSKKRAEKKAAFATIGKEEEVESFDPLEQLLSKLKVS